jgi:RHS repeat-associated protein
MNAQTTLSTLARPLEATYRGGKWLLYFTAFGVLALFSLPLAAQGVRTCGDTSLGNYQWVASGQVARSNNCQGGFRCYPAANTSYSVEKTNPSCNPSIGSCGVRIHATATIPGLRDMINQNGLFSSLTPWAEWYPCAGASCARDMICGLDAFGGRINFDNLDTWLERGLSCAQAWTMNLSVKIRVCAGTSCETAANNKVIDIPAVGLALGLGCPVAPPDDCSTNTNQCRDCQPAGGPCSFSMDGQLSCKFPGPGAHLGYRAGGAGGDNLPGTPTWRSSLGRYFSHDYAKRIVLDPDLNHVWLITEGASFREFRSLAAGGGLRLYDPAQTVPSGEYRKLYHDTATGGWQLDSLDGRRDVFRADGLWEKTIFAHDPGHPVQATYAGTQLQSVSFPDGRQETFTYHPTGKLATITEVGVGGSPSRTWNYLWSGDELTHIARPDGTHWELSYDPARNGGRPGYLTQVRLVGADLTGRIEAGFEYNSFGNVVRAWQGNPFFDNPNAVNKQELTYTNAPFPTRTVLTRTVSGTFNQVTTYDISRDTRGIKPRITAIQGSCPVCGLSPTTTFTYAGSHPLLPSAMTDAKGTRTDYTYDANGRMLTRTEAANVPSLLRTTTYTYDSNFPGLVTRVEVPSTSGGGNKRRTDSAYDATTGLMTTRTIDGFEAGGPLPAGFKTTAYGYNASGKPLTIDPPGFGVADAISLTYGLAGRNGHIADSRTDPLVGTMTFGYDGLNRRTSVMDPNGVETVTSYDGLSRVTEVRQKGALPVDDLVTVHTYSTFGDLFCTKLPRGNGVEYVYDTARRLKEMIRGTAVATPTATSCLDVALPRERTVYQLNGSGNRIEESLERWTGSAWVSDSKTAFEFTCHLDKTTQGAGSPTPSVTEYCYDVNDNLEKVWDANHPKATTPNPTQLHAYDALNRLTSTSVGLGTANAAVTSYTYDVQDHLASVADAEGNLTTYTTSDRDLMTEQVSPVSGTTTYRYNEHGGLVTTTDARAVVTTRTVDAADRPTQETFGPAGLPDPTLTITYAYGSTPAQLDVGRLTGITRSGQTIAYTYDRFGRVLQDGALASEYDKNGNRSRILYPGSVAALYTYDFADREATLSYDSGGGAQPLVTSAGYKALGPLTALSFANGLSETRLFDQRYFPDRIQAGALLDWDYTVDAVGNPTAITGSIIGTAYSTNFAYRDHLYFLTQGDGPWGNRAWTYDKIGNRLSFAKTSEPNSTYTYSGSGHNPKLATITPAPGWGTGSWAYTHDPASNQTSILESNDEGAVQATFYDIAADNRMSALRTDTGPLRTDFLYDGRGFLRQALQNVVGSTDSIRVTPVYSSEGMLMARTEERQWTGATTGPDGEDQTSTENSTETTQLFYLAGRPVAQLTSGSDLLYLTTDHLGMLVLATDSSGAASWAGGVEPFGKTWTAGTDNPDPEPSTVGGLHSTAASVLGRLSSEKIFLRYPGQWTSDAFRVTGAQQEIYYNLYRWYEPATGRYISPDPLGLFIGSSEEAPPHPFAYVDSRPAFFTDSLGLFKVSGSCDCLKEDPFVAPSSPEGPSAPQTMSRFIQLIRDACVEARTRIRDIPLRRCVAESCDSGKVVCRRTCHPSAFGGPTDTILPRLGIPIRTIPVCVDGWSEQLGCDVGRAAVHEWAHGCSWLHPRRYGDDGGGVPIFDNCAPRPVRAP